MDLISGLGYKEKAAEILYNIFLFYSVLISIVQ